MPELPPPSPTLEACVVVPARNEEDRIGACVEALGRQRGIATADFELLLVLDRTFDATRSRARRAAHAHGLVLHLVDSAMPGAGGARRTGMDAAYERLCSVGRSASGLIACTDADSRAGRDWLRAQLEAVRAGSSAIGGWLELDHAEARELAPAVLEWRRRRLAQRLREVIAAGGGGRSEHWNFSGASMSVTAETYLRAGRLEPMPALEDAAFERALLERGVPIDRLRTVAVTTSARREGRAEHGLAHDLAAAERRARLGDPALKPW